MFPSIKYSFPFAIHVFAFIIYIKIISPFYFTAAQSFCSFVFWFIYLFIVSLFFFLKSFNHSSMRSSHLSESCHIYVIRFHHSFFCHILLFIDLSQTSSTHSSFLRHSFNTISSIYISLIISVVDCVHVLQQIVVQSCPA